MRGEGGEDATEADNTELGNGEDAVSRGGGFGLGNDVYGTNRQRPVVSAGSKAFSKATMLLTAQGARYLD